MIIRRAVAFALVLLSLISTPGSANAAGGLIGIDYDTSGMYDKDGINLVRVISVVPESRFKYIKPGDYIFAIEGNTFSSFGEFRSNVDKYDPGSKIKVYFLDASQNLKPYFEESFLVGTFRHPSYTPANAQPSGSRAQSTSQTSDNSSGSGLTTGQKVGAIALLGLGLCVFGVICGGSSGNSGSSNSNSDEEYRECMRRVGGSNPHENAADARDCERNYRR